MKIKIGEKEYNVEVAETEEEKEIGLQNTHYLPENEGMLFVYDEPDEISFWMKDTPLSLDIIFINEDYEVISVAEGLPNDETPHTEQNVKYVLEVNSGSGIVTGDEMEDLEDKQPESKMLILDENGGVQMKLDGGERIFSRKSTKLFIKAANKARRTNKDADYIALGKKIFKEIAAQESREPEYVKE